MNLLRFLKSTKGAIKPLNALALSGAAGVGFFFIANTAADRQIQAERQVRTLSSIAQTSPQKGMLRQGEMLTSINVRDGLNQLATAEERAAMQGNSAMDRYNANQRALDNMGASLGRAAQYADGDAGLNTSNRDVQEGPVRYAVGNPRANAVGNAAGEYMDSGRSGGATPRGGAQNQLASASMARASGNTFSGSYGPSGSAGASGSSASGTEGPRRLSGSMPSGSNIVSQMGLDGATARANSSFGRDRNGRTGRGQTVGSERNELKDILKKSAAADANANASANEGGRAFLASARSSGGITVDGTTNNGGAATSSDLTANTNRKLKAVGNRMKQEENTQEKRQKQNRNLIIQLFATVVGSLGVMLAGASILSNFDDKIKDTLAKAALSAGPAQAALLARAAALKLTRWLIAGAMTAAVVAANAFLFYKAKQFIHTYGSHGGIAAAVISQIAAGVMVGGMVFVAMKPKLVNDFIKKQWNKLYDKYIKKRQLLNEGVNLGKKEASKGIRKLFR